MRKQNRKNILLVLICWALLMTAGFFALSLRTEADLTKSVCAVIPVAGISLLLSAKLPLKVIVKGSMPLYLIVISVLLYASTQDSLFHPVKNIGGLEILPVSLIGLIWFAGAYCVSKYEIYRMRNLLWPFVLLLFVPAAACIANGSLAGVISLFPAVILYLLQLSTDGRVDSSLRGLVKMYFILFIAALLTAPFWLPWLLRLNGIESFRYNGPFAQEMTEAVKSIRLLGPSALMRYEMPAYTYYARLSYSYLGIAAGLRFGWIPLVTAVGSACCFVSQILRHASDSMNSYGRHLALGTGSWFAMRIFLFCFVFYMRSPAVVSLPFTGDVLSVVCDCVLASAAVMLYVRQDEAPEGLLDNKRSMTAMMDVMIEHLNEKLIGLTERYDPEGKWSDFFIEEYEDEDLPDDMYEDELPYETVSPDEIRELKQRILELEQDKKALEERNVSLTEIIEKYAGSMADTIVPESYERDLIFLSHNHLDLPIAEYLARKLEQAGAKAWYYERDIIAGSYPQEIMKALKKTKIFVIIISRTSNVSEEVYNEVGNAAGMLKTGLVIMPLVIDELVLSDFLQHYLGRHEMTFALERPLNAQLDAFAEKVLCAQNGKRYK